MEHIEAEHPRPRHFLLHLSDPHLLGGPEPLYGTVDSEARLIQLFEEVKASGARPEAVIFTGDLADKGDPEAYVKLRAIVDPACEELGAGQLEWLARQLETPAPDGTILALHHPPVPSVLDLSVLVELRDQASLAAVVRNSDVRTILAGHLHYSTTASFAGIPVSVASATCDTQDLNVAVGGTRGRDGAQAFNLVHVYEHTIVHSVVPLGSTPTVGEYVSPEETARRLQAAGVRIPETTKQRGSTKLGAPSRS